MSYRTICSCRQRAGRRFREFRLREFFIVAVEQQLAPKTGKVRQAPPAVGDKRHGPKIGVLTAEQIDEAMFG